MDLLSLARTVTRFWYVTVPVVLVTLFGCLFVAFGVDPVYEARGSFVLVPPNGVTERQIEDDPALGRLNYNNPYLRFENRAGVVDVLTRRIATDETRLELQQAGVTGAYTAAPSYQLGGSSPLIDYTATGTSAEAAVRSAGLIGTALVNELREMQKVYGADDRTLITALAVDVPERATRRISGQLRAVVAVGAAGAVLLLFLLSLAVAVSQYRSERRRHASARAVETAGDMPTDDVVDPLPVRRGNGAAVATGQADPAGGLDPARAGR